MLGLSDVDTDGVTMLIQGKVQRTRPSPFHKGSGEGTAAAATKKPPPAAKKTAARSRKAISKVMHPCMAPAVPGA